MAWECAECGRGEEQHVRVDRACHHCGKLLCRDDRVELADFAFASTTGKLSHTATHCQRCKREHHPLDVSLSGR